MCVALQDTSGNLTRPIATAKDNFKNTPYFTCICNTIVGGWGFKRLKLN